MPNDLRLVTIVLIFLSSISVMGRWRTSAPSPRLTSAVQTRLAGLGDKVAVTSQLRRLLRVGLLGRQLPVRRESISKYSNPEERLSRASRGRLHQK